MMRAFALSLIVCLAMIPQPVSAQDAPQALSTLENTAWTIYGVNCNLQWECDPDPFQGVVEFIDGTVYWEGEELVGRYWEFPLPTGVAFFFLWCSPGEPCNYSRGFGTEGWMRGMDTVNNGYVPWIGFRNVPAR